MIKFARKLSEYEAVLSFDLAKKKTGYSFYNYKANIVEDLGIIDTANVSDDKLYPFLYSEFRRIILEQKNKGKKFFVTKEKIPNQAGSRSTIITLQELAKVHAIFDLAMCHEEVDYYDLDGVHSVSVKAFFKKITNIEKPSKEDIANYLQNQFLDLDFSKFSLDVTDSLAVSFTLLKSKWNKDLQDEIKNLKKEKKKYKTEKKQEELSLKISFLENLMEDNNV